MKLNICPILFVALMSYGVSAIAEESSPLDKAKAVYTESLQKIEAEHQARLKPITDAYYKRLIKVLDKAKADGDFKALVAVKAEEERFLKEKTVPSTPPPGLHALIAQVQKGYNKAVSNVGKNKDKQILNLLSLYIKRLEALKIAYVRKEDIANGAVVVKELDGAKEKYEIVRSSLGKAVVKSEPIAGHKEGSSPIPSSTPVRKPGADKWITPASVHDFARLNNAGNLIDDKTSTANAFSPGGPDHHASFLLSADKKEHTVTHVRLWGSPSYTATWKLLVSTNGKDFKEAGHWNVGGASQWYEYNLPSAVKAVYLRINDRHAGPEAANAIFEFDFIGTR